MLFLSSYRIKSKILGERGMLWESTGINIIVPSDASRTHRKYVAPDSNYSRNKWNVKNALYSIQRNYSQHTVDLEN